MLINFAGERIVSWLINTDHRVHVLINWIHGILWATGEDERWILLVVFCLRTSKNETVSEAVGQLNVDWWVAYHYASSVVFLYVSWLICPFIRTQHTNCSCCTPFSFWYASSYSNIPYSVNEVGLNPRSTKKQGEHSSIVSQHFFIEICLPWQQPDTSLFRNGAQPWTQPEMRL